MREEVEQLLRGEAEGGAPQGPMEGFVRATARYMLQVAIEAEATAFLGRGHYRRGKRLRVGWRNGYEPKGVQTDYPKSNPGTELMSAKRLRAQGGTDRGGPF